MSKINGAFSNNLTQSSTDETTSTENVSFSESDENNFHDFHQVDST